MSSGTPDPGNEAAQRAFGYEPTPPAREPAPVGAQMDATALAGWWPRAAALVLDSLVVFVVSFGLALLIVALAGTDDETSVEVATYAVTIPLSLAYAPLLMVRRGRRNGQTLGKQAMGLRVVRLNGAPVGLGNALLREIVGRQLPSALTFFAYGVVDYLWPVWDKRNQALHDKLAKTLVVRADAARAASPAGPSAAGEQPVAGWLPPQPGG